MGGEGIDICFWEAYIVLCFGGLIGAGNGLGCRFVRRMEPHQCFLQHLVTIKHGN